MIKEKTNPIIISIIIIYKFPKLQWISYIGLEFKFQTKLEFKQMEKKWKT
jgi:hypothetical protein